jgi:4,5-dihydroxyphthalate decarboxylase
MTASLALGRTALTEAFFAAPPPGLELPTVSPIPRAFAAMVREGRYAFSEMAIATFLMARAHAKPLVLLPVVLAERFQEAAFIARVAAGIAGPAELRGRRIGVRAYSQTTGMWLRGVIADRHGIAPDAMRWVTFEDAHVAEFRDPPWVERAAPGATLEGMLNDGALDAAIFGMEVPAGATVHPVFGDPAAAGRQFLAEYGFTPVNHLMVARADVPTADILALLRALGAAGVPVRPRAALNPALTLAARFCAEQGLIARPLTVAEIWAGTPDALD